MRSDGVDEATVEWMKRAVWLEFGGKEGQVYEQGKLDDMLAKSRLVVVVSNHEKKT